MRRARSRLVLALLGVAALAGGCAGPVPSPATPALATPALATLVPASATASPGSEVNLDESLLAILPAEVDGVAVTGVPEAFADLAGDPALAPIVEAAAFAMVADGEEFASGLVARLRPGMYTDERYRSWRDTYDEGACERAGGITGNAEAEIGGRTVHITSCTNGLRAYHAYVEQRRVVVSFLSLGERRFGEQIMAGLRP